MKKIVFLTSLLLCFYSCKYDQKSIDFNEELVAVSEDAEILKGNFIYYNDAGVFQTNSNIYGVVIDQTMLDLNKKVKPYQKKKTDIVTVTLEVKKYKHQNPIDIWENWIKIQRVIKIH